MPEDQKPVRPIYVIKKKVSHGGHHGGAWKVAYADFVTAMMSLFIVLWLLNSTPQVKQAVAGYFNDPRSNGKETGTKSLGAGESVSVDKANVDKLKEEIEKAILKQSDLSKLSKQIEITLTGEGLKIELLEDKGGTFFESGSSNLSPNGQKLISVIAGQLKSLPNRLLVEGHTDAQPFSGANGYSNWELSSDRANSARRVLQQSGVGPAQISQVRGYADQSLRTPADPLAPSNRRIAMIVQWIEPATAMPAETAGDKAGGEKGQPKAPDSAGEKATGTPVESKSGSLGPVATTPEAAKPSLAPATPLPVPAKPTPAPAKLSLIEHLKAMVPGKRG
jgi:chemotaxis protein MotB